MNSDDTLPKREDDIKSRQSGDDNSYRSILKGTSAFGGVQLFQILINLVRGKFVAVILGPDGWGVSSLLASAMASIQQFASLGLNLAIVNEVAASKDDPGRLSRALAVGKRLVMATSLTGALVCLLFSVPLSVFTFGSGDRALWFALLGIAVFFSIAGAGLMSVLQGLRCVRRLSLASLVGASSGLVFGVPLYWLFGIHGIVPAMILLALSNFTFYFISVRRELRGHPRARFLWAEHRPLVRKLIGLGVVMMASSLIGTLVSYAISAWIRHAGSMTDVGLYQAANSATGQYVGLVFAAMSLDYLPRLSAASADRAKLSDVVNRQTEIVSLIIAPIVVAVMLSTPLIIRVLFTGEFLAVAELLRWMAFGVLFKGLMYPLGYISFAREDKRLFFWLEGVMSNMMTLALSVGFYRWFGLVGLGMALVADCSICLLVYLCVTRRRYSVVYTGRTALSVVVSVVIAGAGFAASFLSATAVSCALMSTVLVISLLLSVLRLRRLLRK